MASARDAAFALHRFGLGPRPGGIAALTADPRGALLAELDQAGVGQIVDPALVDSGRAARDSVTDRADRRVRLAAEQRAREEADRLGGEAVMGERRPPDPPLALRIYRQEAQARFDIAQRSEIGFVERLVWFWSNHFCVSADAVLTIAGAFEREAIRPHVLGRFTDMVQAVESHPAMLFYLDNASSIGPNSAVGKTRNRGLNENLAREILELHTLGVSGGYSQADVTSLARIITGWSVLPVGGNPENGGTFTFIPRRHEPGSQRLLGRTYPDSGVEQGRAALFDLAHESGTASHVATKLARYFVADDPPQPLIDALSATFSRTDGDLKALARTLVTAPEAWSEDSRKLRRPSEWITAMLRATDIAPGAPRFLQSLILMGEPLWRPPAPKGYSDLAASWLDGLARRLDLANAFAGRVAATVDPITLVETALGPLASPETREAVSRAESRAQGLALALMAPEFLRR